MSRQMKVFRSFGLVLLAGTVLSLSACSGDKGADKGNDKKSGRRSAPEADRERFNQPADKKADPRNDDKSPEPNTETYKHRTDNPFHTTVAAPLSTLSIGVDTASYSNVRRFINEGKLPPRDAVRVEELINYFPYRYPVPQGAVPVSLTTDLAKCPWNDKHLLARIGLRGRIIDPAQMPPRNFVFLVDTSGSMNVDNRLPLLQKSLHLLTEQLGEKDRVALVAYAGSAGLVLGSTPGNERQRINNAIDRLEAGGSTNGGAGIELAYKVAQANYIEGGVNRVILGTDGDFNVGVSSESELIRLIEQKRKTGVFLTILGFGMGNLKDSTMEQLAYHGNGHHAYIDTLDEAKKLFVEQGAALVTIAKDVKLQVEFNPEKVGAYRLIGFENRLLDVKDFNDDKKNAGAMGSGHTMTALFEIVPAGTAINIPGVDPLKYQTGRQPTEAARNGEWLTVKMRYKHPEKETSELVSKPLKGEPETIDTTADDFRFAASVAAFGMVLRESPYKGTATLDIAERLASQALAHDPQGHRAGFVQMIGKAKGL